MNVNKKRFSPWKVFGIGMALIFGDVIISAMLNRQPDILIIIIASLAIPAAFIIPMVMNFKMKNRIMAEGLPGKAILISARQTGTLINNQPEMDLTVSVTAENGETWQTVTREIVPLDQLYAISPGTTFQIKYDPKNKNNLVFVPVQHSSGNGNTAMSNMFMDIATKQQELYKRLSVTGIPAKAKVLTYTPLGANFNGNNPLISITMEVFPESGNAFTAQTNGVIGESSIHKFQPGCMIHVKYDANDPTQITITGSDQPNTTVTIP